jgi:hypothetical protein
MAADMQPNGTAYRIDITGTVDVVPGGADGRKLAAIRRICRVAVEQHRGLDPGEVTRVLAIVEARDVAL